MDEKTWLTSDDPQAMMRWLMAEKISPPNAASNRRLRLFALACAGGIESGGDWNKWAEREHSGGGEFTASEGAMYWCGIKIGQHHQHKVTEDERMRQSSLFREIFGNPFRPVRTKRLDEPRFGWDVDPSSLTQTVLAIAHEIYESRSFDRMPILADALEEAGCREEELLWHLRGEERCVCTVDELQSNACPECHCTGWRLFRGPHVRGCWALDLILDHPACDAALEAMSRSPLA